MKLSNSSSQDTTEAFLLFSKYGNHSGKSIIFFSEAKANNGFFGGWVKLLHYASKGRDRI